MNTVLPTEPRRIDVDAWRARIDAKSSRARYFERLDQDVIAASARPKRAPKPPRAERERPARPAKVRAPRPSPVRPCPGCGRLTRPSSVKLEDYPGTTIRVREGRCRPCSRGDVGQERRDPVRPCATCGRMTRPSSLRAADYPGTVTRPTTDLCVTCARGGPKPRQERAPREPAAPRQPRVPTETLIALYVDAGLGSAAVGARVGLSGQQVCNRLRQAGIPIRARGHRITRPTGSKPKPYAPELIEKVRALAEQGLTQPEIAEATGTTRKVVWRVMSRHGIAARAAVPAHPVDGASGLKAAMAAAGVTTADVRAWAAATGVEMASRGLPAQRVFDAYLAAQAVTA